MVSQLPLSMVTVDYQYDVYNRLSHVKNNYKDVDHQYNGNPVHTTCEKSDELKEKKFQAQQTKTDG